MGYGDYQIGNVMILRVYFVDGLGHNLFFVGQLCDSDLEVAFRQHTCFIHNLEGVNPLFGSRGNNLYTMSLGDMMKSSPICLLSKASKTKSWLWHRRLSHLNFGAIKHLARQGLVRGLPKLKFKKDHLCSARAMGKSKKKSHKPKSEDTNQEKLYLLHMDLCGPMRDESVNGKKNILVIVDDYSRFTWVKCLRSKDEAPDFIIKFLKMIQVGISHETFVARSPQQNDVVERRNRMIIEAARTILRPTLYEMTPTTISLGIMPNPTSSTPFVPPSRTDWDFLFQPLFDELLNPSPSVDHPSPKVIAPIAEVVAPEFAASTGSPSLTTVDQDAPSPSNSQSTPEAQPPIIPNDVEEDNHDIEVTHMNNDLFFGILIPKVYSGQSSLTDYIHTIVQPDYQSFKHNSKWTKDHPLEYIIGELSRPVSTRLQLHEQALFCYYDDFLTPVEPKTYKDALTQSCRVEAIQEELNEFERLGEEVYVSQSDGFVDQDNPNHVYKLKKALYGLKQAPRAWYNILSSFLISQDFSEGSVDPTMFIRRDEKELLLVQIYVDDIIFAASTPELCNLFATTICSKFKMSMIGEISFFLGLQISQSPRGIFINQLKYALESLKKYSFESCDPVDSPMMEKSKLDEDKEGKVVDPSHYRGMIGTLLYLIASRPDLQFAICMCARTSGSMQFLGDRLVSWSSKRQKCAAISSTEAKYIALSSCYAQILWMRSQLTDYSFGFNKIPMYFKNKSAIALCCNNVQHSRSKHIDIRYNFIKGHVENEVIELYFVNTEYQRADIFTKALGREII
uniref:Retrovirus-related Pol polyprotein from transposon TNT 1-94 n=1 Tax=Tanacetum cinerariifolium TaxID=118510 RepID=A0A6L2LJM9_TANCI|nr:hypothetical protein [Tanacetum cinerariifolium]